MNQKMNTRAKKLWENASRRFGEEYVRQSAYNNAASRWRIVEIVRFAHGARRALDVGCYEGSIASQINSDSCKVAGIDASYPALLVSRNIVSGRVAQAAFEEGLPFKGETFDLVVAGEIIEHIVDTDFFVKELRRVLIPGGKLIVTTPNAASLGRRIYLALGKSPFLEASFTYPSDSAGHVRYFTKDLLADFLGHHGFKTLGATSNVVNFNGDGTLSSRWLASIFPGLGGSLIVKAEKIER